ncbi:MAG: MMPL family transporter [Hyphomicrobium sp.]|uniref:efflux RND transporter permease subunit n=1 Tax=Hyphomicrobium sp. TaxID=82 RepID=UPI001322C0B7|nr:MMPL family transporter [Hyphomicrobium sp.]KAB2940819.1 MAG: MMPL family transporter [Hyphomicrobium sp.]MBZ0209836.1 MMPL family transporter [Hyphomicrobium sp.]
MANDRDERRRSFLFSFGLDRLGLVALKAPHLSALVIFVLTVLAAWSAMHIKVDDSLSELFRTNSEEFRRYEEIDRRFPSSEYDVLVVVEGKDLLQRKQLETFASLTTELQLVDGVSGLVSMLSARDKPDTSGYAPPLVPDEMPADGPAFDAMLAALKSNDIVKGKFLSDDGQLALIVIALDRNVVAERSARTVIGEINEAATRELQGSGLTAQLTGAPVMQLEIRNAVERDRLVYNGLGFLVGIGIAYLFFRRLSLTLIAVAGPAIAILWTLGMIGAMDFRLNLFINVITPLILVSGFSDSMHLVMSIRRDVLAGVNRFEAARHAVLDVAPACLLTAMNAALAIVSFQFADSALIRTFGKAALMAVGISYIAVAVVVPTLAALLVREEKAAAVDPRVQEEGGVGVLQRITDAIVRTVAANATVFFVLSVIAVALCGIAYTQLKPHYRLADQVPDKEQALAATGRIDQKLTGANPVHVMIRWTGSQSLYDPPTLSAIAQAHDVLEQRVGLGNVWSLESLRRWLAAAGDASVENVKHYVGVLPEHLVRRFIAGDEKAVLVTARLPDVDASEILPVVDKLDKELEPIRKANPDYEISVTGLPAIAARNSAELIWELNWGLVGDMFVIFIFLGIALRSVLVGFASIMPSLFPIFATGAILWATGQGLQFASIVAITVAFSLAIDSTIHFLNRFRLEEDRLGPDATPHQVLMRSAHYIGPPVVLTTIVLALGLGVTMLSHLPSLRLFGQLAAVCLFASLIGQLVILPAVLVVGRRLLPRRDVVKPEVVSSGAVNT